MNQTTDQTPQTTDQTTEPIRFVPLYSGGALHLINHALPIVIDLAGYQGPLDGGWPACVNHDPEIVAGTITRLEIGANDDGTPCLNAFGDFLDNEFAWQIKQRTRNGERTEGSIHIRDARPDEIELIPDGKPVEINKRQFVGPIKAVRRWELEEGSFVGFGGDPANKCEIAANGKNCQPIINEVKMNPELEAYLKQIIGLENVEGLDPETLNVLERCFNVWKEAGGVLAEGCDDKKPVAANGDAPPEADKKAPASPEADKKEEPVAANGDAATEGDKKEEPVAASGSRTNPALNLSNRNPRNASTGNTWRPNINQILAIAMMQGLGIDDRTIAASGGYGQAAMNEGLSSRFRNMSLKGMICEAFERRLGGRWSGREAGFAAKALELLHADGRVMASGGFSTISPLTIIQDILQLSYRNGFENFTGVAEKLSDINFNENLMAAKMANYDIKGGLAEVGEDGEIQHGTLVSEEIETQVYTYAHILTITEAMIINDRLDALSKLSTKQGRKAKIQRERAWFKEWMLQDTTLCTNTRGNLITNALGIAGLSAAVAALAGQETIGSTTVDPEFTELEGKYLLVPHALLPTAQTLYVDTKCDLIGVGEHLESNPHVNEYEPISSTYYGEKMSAFGGSNTHWALFGDPAICPAMIISHLRGEEKPRVEKLPVQPNILGYSWRTVYRYGISAGDYRGVVYSTGAGS